MRFKLLLEVPAKCKENTCILKMDKLESEIRLTSNLSIKNTKLRALTCNVDKSEYIILFNFFIEVN